MYDELSPLSGSTVNLQWLFTQATLIIRILKGINNLFCIKHFCYNVPTHLQNEFNGVFHHSKRTCITHIRR